MTFKEYFARRTLNSIVIWIFVLILNFFFFYAPSMRVDLHSLPTQTVEYLKFVFVERFGLYSGAEPVPILDYLFSTSIFSITLLVLAVVIAITLGVVLGTLASYKQGRKIDTILTVAALIPFAFPIWWTGLVFRLYLYPPFPAFHWYSDKWIFQSPLSDVFGFTVDFLSHLILPLMTFLIVFTGVYFIVTRNSLREVYTEEYIKTAKAKGLSPTKIMLKHALRNAAIPVVSIVALTPPLLVLGTIMTEYVFSRNGIGFMFFKSAIDTYSRERIPPTPLLQAVFIVFATIIIVLNFAVDISLSFLDPRIRTDGAGLERPQEQGSGVGSSQPLHKRFLKFMKEFMRGYSGKIGLGIILFFTISGIVVPYLPLPNPFKLGRLSPLQSPNLNHLLGTDIYGRDMLAMVLWGARTSLLEGLGAVIIALVIGYFVGLFSGYYNNRAIGYLLDRVTDLFLSIPIIIIIVYFPNIHSYTPTPIKWMLAVGLTTWPFAAKLVRAAVISAKERPFVEAARAAGAGDRYILFRCLLPDCIPAAASSLPLLAVTALSVQSSLDFIGFERRLWNRIDPVLLAPYMSWGTILSYGAEFRGYQWWLIFPPAICIALVALALVAIGNKVMEVTNPRLRSRKLLL